jgi:hypothetical protein
MKHRPGTNLTNEHRTTIINSRAPPCCRTRNIGARPWTGMSNHSLRQLIPERSKPVMAWSWQLTLHMPQWGVHGHLPTQASEGFILCNMRREIHVTRVTWRQNGYALPPTHPALWACILIFIYILFYLRFSSFFHLSITYAVLSWFLLYFWLGFY